MLDQDIPDDSTAIVFLPVEVNDYDHVFLHGDITVSAKTTCLYVTELCKQRCNSCMGLFSSDGSKPALGILKSVETWIHIQSHSSLLILRKFKTKNEFKNVKTCEVVVIYYERNIFTNLENSLICSKKCSGKKMDHFRSLITRLQRYKTKKSSRIALIGDKILGALHCIFLFLSLCFKKTLFIGKYSNLVVHTDNYLTKLVWLTNPNEKKKRSYVKKINFVLSVLADAMIGEVFLNLLFENLPTDTSHRFLSLAEALVQSLRDLINWLTGDPAGFKLNFMFSKILATFFIFYIDTWCAFIAYLMEYLRSIHHTIFLFFLVIGRLGITFQVSILADIFAIVTFHIHCISLFATRLYNIQISALIALWRLFLGQKKNPLRRRVDSCKYTPEQLFIGTLAFTILLFLFPTTLIYYVVFIFLKIFLLIFRGMINRLPYILHSLQLYSSILWCNRSLKILAEIILVPGEQPSNGRLIVFHAKPVAMSWWETLCHDMPDCIEKPEEFKFLHFLYSLLVGTVY